MAVVTVTLALDSLQHIIAPGDLPQGSAVGLIDERGVLLARQPDPEHWTGSVWSHFGFVQ